MFEVSHKHLTKNENEDWSLGLGVMGQTSLTLFYISICICNFI